MNYERGLAGLSGAPGVSSSMFSSTAAPSTLKVSSEMFAAPPSAPTKDDLLGPGHTVPLPQSPAPLVTSPINVSLVATKAAMNPGGGMFEGGPTTRHQGDPPSSPVAPSSVRAPVPDHDLAPVPSPRGGGGGGTSSWFDGDEPLTAAQRQASSSSSQVPWKWLGVGAAVVGVGGLLLFRRKIFR